MSSAKGFLGGGIILGTGVGVSAFILAIFALTYLNNSNYDDFTDERKRQMSNTAWVYFGFLFAFILYAVVASVAIGRSWKDVARNVTFTGGNMYVRN